MAKNEVSSTYEGRHLRVAASGVKSGDMVLVGGSGLHGVAFSDATVTGCTIDTAGVWRLPIEDGEDISIGDALYCDANGGTLSTDPEWGTFFGFGLEGVSNADGASIPVLVCQSVVVPQGS